MITCIVKFHTKKDGIRQETVDFLVAPLRNDHIFDIFNERYTIRQVQHYLAVASPGGERIHTREFETVVVATPA